MRSTESWLWPLPKPDTDYAAVMALRYRPNAANPDADVPDHACPNLRFHWVAKDSFFRPPFGSLVRSLGGIAIDRSKRNNFVQQVVDAFQATSELIIIIAPEGTRSKTRLWKSGFYHIAMGAGVPVVLGGIDYPTRTVAINSWFYPTGDIPADMDIIRAYYADKHGKFPNQQCEPRLSVEIEQDKPGKISATG